MRQVAAPGVAGDVDGEALPLDGARELADLGQGHGHRLGGAGGLDGGDDGLGEGGGAGPVPHPGVGRRGEEAGEGDRERGLIGVARLRRRQPVPRLAVAAQADQGHGLAETARDRIGRGGENAPVVRERLVHPRRPAVRVGQPEVRLDRLRGVLGGGGVAFDRPGVPARPLEEGPDVVVGLGRFRVEPQGRLELDEGLAGAPRAVEGHAEAELQVGVAGLQLQGEAELADRLRAVAVGVGLQGEGPMALGAAERVPQFVRQRIGHREPDAGGVAAVGAPAAPIEVPTGVVQVAQTAVGQAQRIVHDRRAGVLAQDGFQVVDGGRVVSGRGRGPAELVPHHLGARPERARLLQERPRGIPPAQIDVDLNQPDERREVARPPVVGPPERLRRLLQVAAPLVEMSQVVGPSERLRGQRPGVHQAGFRRLVVLAGHQQHAEAAVGVGPPARPGRGGLQRAVGVAKLGLHRLVHARQVGQRDRQQLGVVDAGGGWSARGQQAGREHAAGQ